MIQCRSFRKLALSFSWNLQHILRHLVFPSYGGLVDVSCVVGVSLVAAHRAAPWLHNRPQQAHHTRESAKLFSTGALIGWKTEPIYDFFPTVAVPVVVCGCNYHANRHACTRVLIYFIIIFHPLSCISTCCLLHVSLALGFKHLADESEFLLHCDVRDDVKLQLH